MNIRQLTHNNEILKRMRENDKGLRIYSDYTFLVIETRKYDEVNQYIISDNPNHKVLLGNSVEQQYLEGIIGIKLDAYPCDYYKVKKFNEKI